MLFFQYENRENARKYRKPLRIANKEKIIRIHIFNSVFTVVLIFLRIYLVFSMKLAYKIPVFTGVAIIATVFVNILALQLFTKSLLPIYQKEIEDIGGWLANSEQIQTLVKIGTLDEEQQSDYGKVLSEISNLSASIKNISNNPELYTTTSSQSLSPEVFSIPAVTSGSIINMKTRSIMATILHPATLNKDSPEWRFIINLLNRILITNLLWLFIILCVYWIWIKKVFSPIETIISNLQKYIDTAEYTNIRYESPDEFSPLVSTINNLHKSLSIQENIRSNFLSDLSHEIRTPITALRCYLEAIEDGMMKIDTDTVPLIQNELSRLSSITERIMEYEHMTSDLLDNITVERFDIVEVVEKIVLEYSPLLRKKWQKIELSIKNDSFVRMDKNLSIQVFHNIFSNFHKYAWENTTLIFSFEKNVEYYYFSFADNGIGIPENEIEFVKEKFYRIDKSRTRDADMSMGIGLSIVDRIAKLHGGALEITKNTPKGVVVKMRIKR